MVQIEDIPVASTSASPDGPAFPPLTRAAVDACAFKSWHATFKRVTPKATIIDLDPEFVDYLRADGLFLPDDGDSNNGSEASDGDPNGEAISEIDDDDDDKSSLRPRYDFSKLSPRIQQVIDEYGSVFPKLNWSSPQDAAFMCAGPPLKCISPNEVYLLLKSSDFITHDLDHAYEDCVEEPANDSESTLRFHLVLKKWFEMPRSHEFRCFVRDRNLLAISQRDSNFYDFLQEDSRQNTLSGKIQDFFKQHIRDRFTEDSFVFDVYITRDESRVFLLDFNPFAARTDSLLFSWEELLSANEGCSLSFRVIQSEAEASQSMPSFSHNRYPQEVVGMSYGASIAEFAQKWRTAFSEASAKTPESSNIDLAGR